MAKSQDKLIGLERESHESGIVDPEKEKLADQHSIPGKGDPSIRRKNPDQGSLITPPLSEQDDQFQDADDKPPTSDVPAAKGNTQLPEDRKHKKAA